jgi:transketolase
MSYMGTREAFAAAMMTLAAEDKKYLVVLADTKNGLRLNHFGSVYPERIVEAGVAEQNAVNMAAGIAAEGLVPFVASYAGFVIMRACEQVRTFVAYSNLNVKLVGCNGGLVGGEREGPTHQFYEDIAIARAIPNMVVVSPCDAHQAYQATLALGKINGPAYLRLGSGREPVVTGPEDEFELGKARVLVDYGDDIAIFACGYIMERALRAARELHEMGVEATVVDVHTIKPLDTETIVTVLSKTKAAITYEDHNIIGGLFSAVSEVSARYVGARVIPIGIRDVFAESGKPDDLLAKYKMDVPDIISEAVSLMKWKKSYEREQQTHIENDCL